VWLCAVVIKAVVFDTGLQVSVWPWSFYLVGAASLATASVLELRRDRIAYATTLAQGLATTAAVLGIASGVRLFDGRAQGLAILGVGVVYAALAAAFFGSRHRNFSSALSGLALIAAAIAAARLADGQVLVAVWAAGGAALAWLVHAAKERRFQIAALAYTTLALGAALVEQAPPSDLFRAAAHPGSGLPSVAAVIVALVALALAARPPRTSVHDALDKELDRNEPLWRTTLAALAGVLGLYGLSLAILEVAERIGPYDVAARFQNGHTAVSAAWGILGLGVLIVGLKRGRRSLRLGGFALLGVSLAKLFLYDLAWLSSIARALSFLAVGAMLLLGGFFYQRLTDERKVA
jgi:hypothetical protein